VNGYRFVFPVEVRFRDLDAIGHVNNAVYLTYMESARLAYWMQVTGRRDLRDIGIILARTECDYRSPANLGEVMEVGVRCASMRRSSFVLEFRIEVLGTERLVAEARKVLVRYDYSKGAVGPLEDDLKARLRAQDPESLQE